MIRAVAEDYLSSLSTPASIQWICNHSRNTQLALLNDYIDIALTYERDQEELAASEGWSNTVGCIFHDHFCLAGPSSDPGNVFSSTTIREALTCIAQSKSLFHSRADTSATMWKEHSLWEDAEMSPWKDPGALGIWYKTSLFSPAEALTAADQAGAYLLTDRSTLLSLVRSRQVHNTTVFWEPDAPDHPLMNSCYALLPQPQSDVRRQTCQAFIDYLLSDRGQHIIATFGVSQDNLFPLFAKVNDGFAGTFLRGGGPRNGCWKVWRDKPRL